jgi:hypothetical protein
MYKYTAELRADELGIDVKISNSSNVKATVSIAILLQRPVYCFWRAAHYIALSSRGAVTQKRIVIKHYCSYLK